MHPQQKNTELSIEILRNAKQEIDTLMKEVPNLQMRCNNVLRTLINGLLFTIGKVPEQETPEDIVMEQQEPLTHILGKKINNANPIISTTTKPEKSEVELLREKAKEAYSTFIDNTNKELINSLTDMEIRAVARLAKMPVTPTEPAKITNEFIDEIREKIITLQKENEIKSEAKKLKSKEDK